MNKKSFLGTILLMSGDLCLIMGIILSCVEMHKYLPMGIGVLICGAILLIAGIITCRGIEVSFNPKKVLRVLGVIVISALLHAIGIYLMINVFWVIGLVFVLLGVISLAFIGPAVKGFKD